MTSLVVKLIGKHSNRTPFSYPIYRKIFESKGFKITVDDYLIPDIVVLAFHVDIFENKDEIRRLLNLNSCLRVLIVSEEPLWDLTWNSDPFVTSRICEMSGIQYEYYNYYNSSIFQSDYVPYFITTESKYIIRYKFMIDQILSAGKSHVKNKWDFAEKTLTCFVEKRVNEKYAVQYIEKNARGYSVLRTKWSTNVENYKNVELQGKGWGRNIVRQALPDWHADKLAFSSKKTKFLMSIENVNAPFYVTEKVYDAFASCSIPLVHLEQCEELSRYFNLESLFKVHGDDGLDLIQFINSTKIDSSYLDCYYTQLMSLSKTFADFDCIQAQRESIVEKLNNIINARTR
ncbi:glycosyltransferase family 10 [Rheinheimera baltica]|uniref:glycosyltransferase family 10 domain-containing protein n=1 Tax=Rheinheimera baltica TaxID=67576 RepID=UPI00273F0EE8|nr:glycosyltransferase family 10 [Rheinheimera baltica]MDP5143080.1 glycosyltransferase family 10 [Rheinheimera baltica]